MTALLSSHGALLSDAPDGIEKLRRLVRQLAVIGKLTVVKRGPDTYDGWRKAKFGEVFSLEYGENLPSPKRTGTGEFPVYGSNGVVGSHAEACVHSPCLVVGRKGSAGAVNVCEHHGCWVTDVAYYCVPPDDVTLRYTHLLFLTLGLEDLGKGIKPGLSRSEVNVLPISLPPAAEQHLIVAKVDEMMALCDRLGARQRDAEAAHARLVQTLLDSLAQARDADEFQACWQRIAGQFSALFTSEGSVNGLVATVLELAVSGRLVTPMSEEEPAEQLLRGVASVKAHLAETASLRTTAQDDVPIEEHYLSCPAGWAYARIGNLARFIDYRGRTPEKTASGVPLITAKNVRPGFISREPREYIAAEEFAAWMTRGLPRVGDMLFTTEAPLGNVALIDIDERFALAQRVICFQLHCVDMGPYLRLAFMSPSVQKRVLDMATGMTAPGVKAARLKELPLPIPPLSEQRRLVAKVTELLALCDQLKARIAAARATHAQLADSLVEAAVA